MKSNVLYPVEPLSTVVVAQATVVIRWPAVKLPSSRLFAYRRLAANFSEIILQKRVRVRVCRFDAKCTMPSCYAVVNLREISGRKEARAGKNFSGERPRRRHFDDGSSARLPPVIFRNLSYSKLISRKIPAFNWKVLYGVIPVGKNRHMMECDGICSV